MRLVAHRQWLALLLLLSEVSAPVCCGNGSGQRRGQGERRRKLHRVQHGQCSYTFILPEMDSCRTRMDPYKGGKVVQRDAPPGEGEWPTQRLQHLETAMENNTQWLQKLETYIQENMKSKVVHTQANVVHNQTATMLEIGTNLLTQTAEQTKKLNVVEAKVMNQTSRLEIQLLEHSLSTNKLEKELLLQITEISKLREKNSRLESKVLVLETQQRTELEDIREEKERLQDLVGRQSAAITALERQLRTASSNSSALQKQQQQLMKSIHALISLVSAGTVSDFTPSERKFRDCAEAYRSGLNTSGVYHIYVGDMMEPTKVFCDMETSGGGWTVFQRRINGTVDFQRSWKEYKMGFGDPDGEHWVGNEVVHLITRQTQYSLRVELKDWEGNAPYSLYDTFQLANEKQQYRLLLRGYSGTAGQQSSLASHGTSFSTRDSDNDNCLCKCALMLTGGWWFDACGLSNLNGMYYTVGHNIRKLNGIKWHHFRGPSYSLKSTTMMIRPTDF
ncbi:angiopoietin-4 isoform X1 [Electrophorus electricus]|uniref:angiopoietin-4 isoform X1 n=1 Tax=Electrophorus electricus TaxID=8005 RepID=UPI0015D03F5B|nr:angiopoietin-4 isoform X1 [Electrophorus electricus]